MGTESWKGKVRPGIEKQEAIKITLLRLYSSQSSRSQPMDVEV